MTQETLDVADVAEQVAPEPTAYQYEVYSDHLVIRGVCSNAPLEDVVRWMNATSKFRWAPAEGMRFPRAVVGHTDEGVPIWDEPMSWPIPCPDKAETHQHYILRSGA